jgi:hypothetical protein
MEAASTTISQPVNALNKTTAVNVNPVQNATMIQRPGENGISPQRLGKLRGLSPQQ